MPHRFSIIIVRYVFGGGGDVYETLKFQVMTETVEGGGGHDLLLCACSQCFFFHSLSFNNLLQLLIGEDADL